MPICNALAVLTVGTTPVEQTIERREPSGSDVVIDIAYCGICHSDLHTVNGDWGKPRLPLVVGHEIIGTVTALGPEATRLRVGQRVGVGCNVDSCFDCTHCHNSEIQYCPKHVSTYDGTDFRNGDTVTQGGYAESIVVREAHVYTVPESLDMAGAAPLLCAGITMFSPLKRWGAGPGKKVGIVGLGGLGHLGIKIAKAMGAEVYLFSRSDAKVQDALDLGATGVVISSDKGEMSKYAEYFDLIVDTVPYEHDVTPYLKALKVNSTLNIAGYFGPLSVNAGHIALRGKVLTGSLIGGIAETQEMLDFCGKHGIVSEVEIINATAADLKDAYERVLKADVKYRFVIDTKELKSNKRKL